MRAYDVDLARAKASASESSERRGLDVRPVKHVKAAVDGLDIVVGELAYGRAIERGIGAELPF